MVSLTLNELAEHVKKSLKPQFSVRVALSGGIDSMALLNACIHLKQQGKLVHFDAIYINHLEPYSDQAEAFCLDFCHKHGIELHCIKIPAKADKNREANWRQARYTAICFHTPLMTQILLAHHLEDQAETFIMNAMRGSGPLGLAGMKQCQFKQQRLFIRPFLHIEKDVLIHSLRTHGIDHIQDPSNADTDFKRNFIRHTLMPTLANQWHKPNKQLALSASLCQINDNATPMQAAVGRFRLWLKGFDIILPRTQVSAIFHQLHTAQKDKQVHIRLNQWHLVRIGRMIYLDQQEPYLCHQLTQAHKTYVYNKWLMISTNPNTIGQGIALKYVDELKLGPRLGGETIQIHPNQPKQKVKKLLQSWSIPPRMKLNCPLIYQGKTVVAIPGFAIDHRFCDTVNTLTIKLISQENLAGYDSVPQRCLDDFFVPVQHLE